MDGSSAQGWIQKSSFDPFREEPHDKVAIWFGWTLIIKKVYLYSHHIKLTNNIIEDSLSREFHPSDKSFINIFKHILPLHAAESFHIKIMTRDISFWILLLSASTKQPQESTNPLWPISLEPDIDGAHSSHTQALRKKIWAEYNTDLRRHWCCH